MESRKTWVYAARMSLATVFSCALAFEAGAAPVLDQEFEPVLPDGSFSRIVDNKADNSVFSDSEAAQVVTVGLAGKLTRVDVLVRSVNPGGPLALDITSLIGGVPGGTVLASSSIGSASVPASPGWISFDLASANLVLSAGQGLAIVLRASVGSDNNLQDYDWYGEYGPDATYAGGDAWYRDVPPGTWAKVSDLGSLPSPLDFGFRTFVDVAEAPSPGALPLVVAGLASLALAASRRKPA